MRSEYLPFGKPNFGPEETEAVTRVLRSGWVGMGPETLAFEAELAAFVGAPHVVTVSSCTSALFLSLLAAGIGPGDEVICPSLTWCSTANAALYLGATPVFCDVDSATLNVTPQSVAAALSPRTRAVIVVHYGGRAVDVAAVARALPSGVKIVEDAAHAFGGQYPGGAVVGAAGHLACFSFYANKNLSTGEGGAVALFDEPLALKIRSLRLHGLPVDAWKRFTDPKTAYISGDISELGYKMNFTDLQAALGRAQLKRFAELQARRAQIAHYYLERIAAEAPEVRCQAGLAEASHARHLFVVQLPLESMRVGRDQFLLSFRARKLGATLHYSPLHSMPLYRSRARALPLPATEDVAKRILTLPISASMTTEDARDVCDHLVSELRAQRR
jgi:perosamine synthetase